MPESLFLKLQTCNLAYRKSETQDPKAGPGTQDPKVAPYSGTLGWDTKVTP